MDCLKAFTLAKNTEEQLRAWDIVKERHWISEYNIKEIFTEEKERGSSQLAKYVGAEAYELAGGAITKDLFSENNDNDYFDNGILLEELAEDKFQKELKKLQEEGGVRHQSIRDQDSIFLREDFAYQVGLY